MHFRRAGRIPNFTGISAPYEAPDAPEVHLRTVGASAESLVEELLAAVDAAH
jgi:bifunctional enzyme CysN/CysC